MKQSMTRHQGGLRWSSEQEYIANPSLHSFCDSPQHTGEEKADSEPVGMEKDKKVKKSR